MNFKDKLIIESVKQLIISSNYPLYYKQSIIREIDFLTFIKDILNPNDYYNSFIWYYMKEIFRRMGIMTVC